MVTDHYDPYQNMLSKLYKQSEKQETSHIQLSEAQIRAFLGFAKTSSHLYKQQLPSYDYDSNQRQKRAYYIDKRHQHTSRMIQEKHSRSLAASQISQKSSKKSVKPKVQVFKKSQSSGLQRPSGPLITKIDQEKPFPQPELDQNVQQTCLSKLPMNSLPIKDGPKKSPQQAQKVQKQIPQSEEVSWIPNGKYEDQPRVQLPMIDKGSRKKYYYGQQQPQITTLNEFIVKPQVFEYEQKCFKSNINKHDFMHSNVKPKMQKAFKENAVAKDSIQQRDRSRKQPQVPIQRPADNFLSNKPIRRHQLVQSELINTQSNDKDRSKSKSASKIKQIKETTLFKRKTKINNPLPEMLPAERMQISKNSPSPQINHEPITHMASLHSPINGLFSRKNSAKSSHIAIPVQDYDQEFDKESRRKGEQEYNQSQLSQNVQANTPYSHGFRDYTHPQYEQRNVSLSYYAIPIYPIKKEKQPQSATSRRQKPESKKSSQCQRQQIEENRPRGARKKIFSHTEPERSEEKATVSTDIAEYSEQEMKMILGAKGNKYKETIVKQYIKLQREKEKNY